MYCGFFACRGELLYDFDRSGAYWNSPFFESVVQKKIDEIRYFASNNNREALAERDRAVDAAAERLKTALIGVSDALAERYAALGFDRDAFDGSGNRRDAFLARYYNLRPDLRDKPDEQVYQDCTDNGILSSDVGALWTAVDLICGSGYTFSVSANETDRHQISAALIADLGYGRSNMESEAYYGADVTAASPSIPAALQTEAVGQTEMPTAASVPEPAADTTAAPETASPPDSVSASSATTPVPTAETTAPAAETTGSPAYYHDYEEYLSALQTGENEAYEGGRQIARMLADCFLLRQFLISAVDETSADALRAMTVSAQGTNPAQWAAEDMTATLSARYFFRVDGTEEYLSNLPAYSGDKTASLQSGEGGGIPEDVKKAAQSAEWFVVIDENGVDTNLGNGTEGEASLRREALGYVRMSDYTAERIGGALMMYGTKADGASDLLSYIANDFAISKHRQPYLIAAAAIGVAVFLLSAAYILIFGTKTPVSIDKLYNDWHFVISGALAAAAGISGTDCLVRVIGDYGLFGSRFDARYSLEEHSWELTLLETLSPLLFALAVLILLEYLASVIRSGRNGRLIAHSFWFAAPRAVVRRLKKQRESVPAHYRKLFLTVLIVGIVLIFSLCFVEIGFGGRYESVPYAIGCLLALGISIAALAIVLRHIRGIDAIADAAERIQNGDLTADIDIGKLPRYLRPMAVSVMCNRDGIREAVDRSVRDERMKTALITNVSHDLKTPLTSIISYSDLLSKPEQPPEKMKEYAAVIQEKANVLKRLIEDLTEASKASTGNIKIERVRLNLHEIAAQAVGEYADELEKRSLEAVVNAPEEDVTVSADSRQTWRIIENLLSNVKKYAMPGTRVYIDVRRQGGYGIFEIKNVSESPLNIPAEELTQRFVRGDASRTTEGSGLGLSIARSLCELQGGRFEIAIDGDLFKVSVALPAV